MNTQELRIDNWVNYKGEPIKLNSISRYGIYYTPSPCKAFQSEVSSVHVQVIPLTEEILLKCGFKKYEDVYSLNMFGLLYYSGQFHYAVWQYNGYIEEMEFSDPSEIDTPAILYVHQLQNLYFALTGKELPITF